MAWFRCGGSGISASLKSGMNSVLNKKFGTSTTYDPSGWPDDVNLLGPLPIKSASGAIASFADGADGVPVKSCVVSFLPSGGGGTPSAPVAIVGHSGITLTNKDNMSTPTHTDTYTDTFGQTIYGGTRDLTTDKASVTIAKYQITSFSGTWGAVTNGYGYYVSVADTTHNTAVVISSGMLANHSFTYGSLGRSQAPTWQYGGNDGGVSVQTFILPSEYDTLTKANQWLTNNPLEVTLTLATPTEITGLTPHEIDTLYGDNNIYADTGTTTVEYRADIDLALNA